METLEHSPIPYGPLIEETMLSAGLDYYKLTMSQLQYEKHSDAEVTFTWKNRGDQRVADYVQPEELQERLDFIRERGWHPDEIEYFRSIKRANGGQMFSDDYLAYLVSNPLPEVNVRYDEEKQDLAIDTTGKWPLVTFWETVVMSEVSELYFANWARTEDIDINEVYAEGDRRFDFKTDYLAENPDVKLAEFGTRRRFSLRWQKHAIQRLKAECAENLIGTSNIAMSATEGLKPVGTFAHELPMVYAGIADALGKDIRASHSDMLNDWYDYYGDDLSTALSDTFGSDFFFEDFAGRNAERFRGTRHDSGDPLEYGEKTLRFYEQQGIDPATKVILFSDDNKIRPDNNTVDLIHRQFENRIAHPFGIGTDISNDLGIPSVNNVMKATHVYVPEVDRGADTVKLSDNPGKHVGPVGKVALYKEVVFIPEPCYA